MLVTPQQIDFTLKPHCVDCIHNHDAVEGVENKLQMARDAKETALKNPYLSAGEIIEMLYDNLEGDAASFPKLDLLARRVNRFRAKQFPSINISDIHYEINMSALQGTFSYYIKKCEKLLNFYLLLYFRLYSPETRCSLCRTRVWTDTSRHLLH